MYYIISFNHTNVKDAFITLWRPDNAGYTTCQEFAGIYETYKKGYHDSDGNMPVRKEVLDKLFLPSEGKQRLLNHKAIWLQLGIKTNKKGYIVGTIPNPPDSAPAPSI
jgi:hypothetical protein